MAADLDDVVKATAGLAKRAGATQFKVYYSGVAANTRWFAEAKFSNVREPLSERETEAVKTGVGTHPVFACESLAVKLLDGSVCARCNHVIAVTGTDPTYCQWRRKGDVWAPGCGLPIDESIELVPRG